MESLLDESEVDLVEPDDCHDFDVVECLVYSEDHTTWRIVVEETGSVMRDRIATKEVRGGKMASWMLTGAVNASCFSTFDYVLQEDWP